MKHFLKSNKKYFLILLLSGFFVFSFLFIFKDNNRASALTSGDYDAIAIRVIPNPKNYSPLRWYKDQGFTGSPQSITVDGYEAVRDGRSVYVNAANISGGTLFTNIYLISYSQEAEKETTDIFSRILKNWKFNTNISGAGYCSVPKKTRITTSDCTGTIACWHLDDNYNDDSGNGFNASAVGEVPFNNNAIFNKSAEFSNNYLEYASGVDINTDKITISAWINHKNAGSNYNNIVSRGDTSYGIALDPQKRAFFELSSGSGKWLSYGQPLEAEVWHHLVGVYDGATMNMYVDGVLQTPIGSNVYFGNLVMAAPGTRIGIGCMGGCGRYFSGLIDEVKIYDYALTASQVLDEYNKIYSLCTSDSDCLGEGYCSSPKADITRDTIRLSRLVDLNSAISQYKNKNGRYPVLESGTYLPNSTLSTWPSWQETLGKELGTALPLDPINKLGNCAGYDKNTCWNKDKKEFSDSDLTDPDVNPPVGSNVFIYSGAANGLSYNICSVMESGYVSGAGSGACAGSATITYAGSTLNTGPKFTGSNLQGNSGDVFNGYLAGIDPEGDYLNWSISTTMTSWPFWSAPPVLQNTAVANQKKVYSLYAGRAGNYGFSATIDDGTSTTTQNFIINIINNPPTILANNFTFTASSTKAFYYKLTAQDSVSNYPLSYNLVPPGADIIGPANVFTLSGTVYNFEKTGFVAPIANTFDSASSLNPYTYKIYVGDRFGATSTKDFTITVVNNPPKLTIPPSCGGVTRIGQPYACQPTGTDPESNIITYSTGAGLPPGLAINPATGRITGNPSAAGSYAITVIATDEFNYDTQQSYNLKVNTYCGDSVVQSPNDENNGGPANNGVEDCDDGDTDNTDSCDSSCTWTCKALTNIKFDVDGINNGMTYDTNNLTTSIPPAPIAGGTYLKLAKSMPTPYIWVADTNNNLVYKFRTYDGQRRNCSGTYPNRSCFWVPATWETRGQRFGPFATGVNNPSRTAVNVETGEMWVAGRISGSVSKLDINGNIIKTCCSTQPCGGCPNNPGCSGNPVYARGLAIEENGDVWVANYYDYSITRISGDDTDCSLTYVLGVGAPYGLAIDQDNHVWVADAGNNLREVDTTLATPAVIGTYPTPRPYGITVDKFGNVWAGRWDGAPGYSKLAYGAAASTVYGACSPFTGVCYATTGISEDLNGEIWAAAYNNDRVIKINQAGAIIADSPAPTTPHGICGDSVGQVWSDGLGAPGQIRAYDTAGGILGTWSVAAAGTVFPYTYSDMTGLNRAMVLRSGDWISDSSAGSLFDSGFAGQHWGSINWQQTIDTPSKQSIDIWIRASDDPTFSMPVINYIDSATWNSLPLTSVQRQGRYMQVRTLLRSNIVDNTPVLWDLQMTCGSVCTVDGTCNSGAGENSANCPLDCSPMSGCTFPLTFPCIL